MHSAFDVAKWLLCYNRIMMDSAGAEYLSHIKLQNLLYYAQGSFLAVTGDALFDEPIETWTYGAVVPLVYRIYRGYGDGGIEPSLEFQANVFSDEESDLLTDVYHEFGQFSAWKLCEMVRKETPYQQTKRGKVIPIREIKAYFLKNYVD